MTNPKLNHFYEFEELFALPQTIKILRWGRVLDLYLPTAVCLTKPGFHVPRVARAYRTEHYAKDGVIFSCTEVRTKLGYERSSLCEIVEAGYKPLYLYEYWEDSGSDGHLNYDHRGYIWSTTEIPEDGVYPEDCIRSIYNDWYYAKKDAK